MTDLNKVGIHFGAMSPPLKVQLKEFNLNKKVVMHLQKLVDSTFALYFADLLSEMEKRRVYKRLMKKIVDEIKKSRSKKK
jgi:hypothetical protein